MSLAFLDGQMLELCQITLNINADNPPHLKRNFAREVRCRKIESLVHLSFLKCIHILKQTLQKQAGLNKIILFQTAFLNCFF